MTNTGIEPHFLRSSVQLSLPVNSKTLPGIDVNTNRFNANQGYSYDKAGNLVNDAENRTFVFNGDNKQVEVKDADNNVIGSYFYDGDGKRIKKVTAAGTTVFVYSMRETRSRIRNRTFTERLYQICRNRHAWKHPR